MPGHEHHWVTPDRTADNPMLEKRIPASLAQRTTKAACVAASRFIIAPHA
jgi:hypothetical protein